MTNSSTTPNVFEASASDEAIKPPLINDKAYDVMKYIAMYVISPLSTLVMVIGSIWSLDIMQPIALTIAAVGTFLAAVLGYSTKSYQDYVDQIAAMNKAKADLDAAKKSLANLAQKSSEDPQNK